MYVAYTMSRGLENSGIQGEIMRKNVSLIVLSMYGPRISKEVKQLRQLYFVLSQL